jgi:acetylornithine/succinyldiaminopimelate/putrescine aminotransferase
MGAKPKVMESFSPGDHASTFGGNHLACAVAKSVIQTMQKLKLPQRAAKIGKYFKSRLEELANKHECIREVRGMGLMLALEVSSKELADQVVENARDKGFLINVTADKVLRFLPPLVVEHHHIDSLIKTLDQILESLTRESRVEG